VPALLCRKCGFNNPPGMRFCGNCGNRLGTTGMLAEGMSSAQPNPAALPEQMGVMMGADLLERFQQAGLEAKGQRRNVTLLFADLSGFTGLSQRLDTEELFVLIQQYTSLLARIVYKFEGMVDKFIGDGLMAIFGAPIAQENNTEMAVRAALEMQKEIARFSLEVQDRFHNEELRLHIGLHTGTVIVGSMGSSMMMNYTAIGDVVNLAARLQQNADPGAILVSQAVYQFTRPLFEFKALPPLTLKGYAAPAPAFLLVGPRVSPGSMRGIEGLAAPLVGRQAELQRLHRAANRLLDQHQGQVVLIEGEAGIGKSRLMAELRAYLKPLPVRVLIAQSYTYRRTVAYWVFQDLLCRLFGLQQNTPEPLAITTIKDHLQRRMGAEAANTLPYIYTMLSVGLDRPEVIERTRYLEAVQLRQLIFLAVRQVLAAEARANTLVLIFEDIHWADEASIDLLETLIDAVLEAPYICLAISRQFQGEGLGRLAQKAQRYLGERCVLLSLVQLTPQESQTLLGELLAIPELPAALHEQIISRAAGNPFYLEEILRMLIDAHKIYFSDNHWRLVPGTEMDDLGVPDTLQALILARFDRLEPAHRRALQVAAVIGRNFSSAVLAQVLLEENFDLPHLPAMLDELDRRGFILPQAGLSDFDYLFKHVLVSDAIYSTLLKAERSELHGMVGEAVETLYPDRTSELVELLARHYAWSARSDRALHYLILSGQKDARNYANQQSRQSFEQAIEIMGRIDHTPKQALEAHSGLGDVLVFTGDYPAALAQYQAALAALPLPASAATRSGFGDDEASEIALRRSGLQRKLSTAHERQGSYDQAMSALAEAQAALNQLPAPDPIEQAWIFNAAGWIHLRRGSLEAAEEALLDSLKLVQDTAEYDIIASIYNRLGGVAYQKGQLEQASRYVQRSLDLRQRIGDVNAVARSYNNLGLLNWRHGSWDSALENFKRSVELHGTLGDVEGTIDINSNLGLVYLDRGDFENAYHCFEQALNSARQIGHSYHIGLSYLHLARYFLFQRNWQQALENCSLSQKTFDEIGVAENRVTVEVYTGQAWLGLDNPPQARSAAEQALRLLEPPGGTGDSEERAHALRLWAQVNRVQYGNTSVVTDALRQSVELFGKVGNLIEEARSQRILAEVLEARGDFSGAARLTASARQVFTRLGARPDLEQMG